MALEDVLRELQLPGGLTPTGGLGGLIGAGVGIFNALTAEGDNRVVINDPGSITQAAAGALGACPSGYPRELLVDRTNPCTGKTETRHYVNRGKPMLYSGDLAACRRVARVGKAAMRAVGSRRRPR